MSTIRMGVGVGESTVLYIRKNRIREERKRKRGVMITTGEGTGRKGLWGRNGDRLRRNRGGMC